MSTANTDNTQGGEGEPGVELTTQGTDDQQHASTPKSDTNLVGSSNHDPRRVDVEPFKPAVFITAHPCVVCCLSWLLIIITLIMSAFRFDIAQQNTREFVVEDDKYQVRADALALADASQQAFGIADVTQPPQSALSIFFSWTIYFRSTNKNGFLLTPEGVRTIKETEDLVINKAGYSNYCWQPEVVRTRNWGACSPLGRPSLAREIFFLPNFATMKTADIKAYVRSRTGGEKGKAILPQFNADYNSSGNIWLYRSQIWMGAPIPTNRTSELYNASVPGMPSNYTMIVNMTTNATNVIQNTTTVVRTRWVNGSIYKNSADRRNDQRDSYNKNFGFDLWNELTRNPRGRLMKNGMQIVAFCLSPLISEFGNLLLESTLFAVGSCMFVLSYLRFHLRSCWLACAGMTQILMAFPFAFAIYSYIYGISYFGFLSYLIIFVLLGLGADDIFVLVDAFHQSEHIVKNPDDLFERMSYTYRRAAKAMLVTQMTTFFAFLATSASVLMPVSAFGLWAATLVACNYLLVVTMYVAALVIWQTWLRENCEDRFFSWVPSRFPYCFDICIACCCKEFYKNCFGQKAPDHPCCPGRESDDAVRVKSQSTAVDNDSAKPPAALTRQKSVEDLSEEYLCLERFFGITWVDFVVKAHKGLLVMFIIIVAICSWGASTLQPQTENEQFFPEDHYFNFLFTWPRDFYQGENDGITRVQFYWGISGVDRAGTNRFDTEDFGKIIYDSGFDMTSPGAQQYMMHVCTVLRNDNTIMFQGFVNKNERVQCIIDYFRFWLTAPPPLGINGTNGTFPYISPRYNGGTTAAEKAAQKEDFMIMMHQYLQANLNNQSYIDLRRTGKAGSYKYEIRFVKYICFSQIPFFSSPGDTRKNLDNWEAATTAIRSNCWKNATGVCNPNFLDQRGAFTGLAVGDAFVSSATTGIAIALPLAFVILILSTHNWILSIMCVLDIGGVVVTELAIMAAQGWQFGVSESVALIMMIGFSVDYVVHLGHAYIECPFPQKVERLKYAMLTMGISVVSGGITTFGAGVFLAFPIFIFFRKIGTLLMTTIIFSLFWALLFFTSIIVLWGPEGTTGRVPLEKLFFCCPSYFEDHLGDAQKHGETKGEKVEIR